MSTFRRRMMFGSYPFKFTFDRIVSIVEEGVGYLVENGDNDLEKFNSDDISISVNRQGSPSKQLSQDQMVSY